MSLDFFAATPTKAIPTIVQKIVVPVQNGFSDENGDADVDERSPVDDVESYCPFVERSLVVPRSTLPYLRNGTLVKGVAAIDKNSGKLIILRVQ